MGVAATPHFYDRFHHSLIQIENWPEPRKVAARCANDCRNMVEMITMQTAAGDWPPWRGI
jgi:hypothetical protein